MEPIIVYRIASGASNATATSGVSMIPRAYAVHPHARRRELNAAPAV